MASSGENAASTAVDFVYDEAGEEPKLRWTFVSSSSPGGAGPRHDWKTRWLRLKHQNKQTQIGQGSISLSDIITIIHPTRQRSIYQIIYVKSIDAASADKSISPVTVESVTAKNLPGQVLKEFPDRPHSFRDSIMKESLDHEPRLHIIVSTGAGTHQAHSVWDRLLEPLLRQLGLQAREHYRVHLTQSDSTVVELTNDIILPRAVRGVAQTIVLLSGDGGTLDIVNALLSSSQQPEYRKPTIAILPLGTGNALAHSARVTSDNTLGTRAFVRGIVKDLPLFRARFSTGARRLVNEGRNERPLHLENHQPCSYGAVVVSWGFHATLVADSDTTEYRKFGAERFKMAGKEALYPEDGSPPHAYRGQVSFVRAKDGDDWVKIERETHGYVLATYCHQLEKGFVISPDSRPLDGRLMLVHFGPLAGQQVMEIMGAAYNGGKHTADERVGYQDIRSLRIQFDEEDARWRRVCIDGNIIRVEKGGWVEVEAGVGGVVDLLVPN